MILIFCYFALCAYALVEIFIIDSADTNKTNYLLIHSLAA